MAGQGTGTDEVLIDDGEFAPMLRKNDPDGVDRVLELIGTTTLLDSLRGEWELSSFSADGAHPHGGAPHLPRRRRTGR